MALEPKSGVLRMRGRAETHSHTQWEEDHVKVETEIKKSDVATSWRKTKYVSLKY